MASRATAGGRALDRQELPVVAAPAARTAPAITLRSARSSAVGPIVVRMRTRLRSSSAVSAPALVHAGGGQRRQLGGR